MEIKELKVTVGEVCEGYFNDAEEGVVGYDGCLDIRPKYQREFVYKDVQRDEVIRTVMKGLPLNVIYWCKVKKDDGGEGFEVLDGQQRTVSLCEYVDGSFSVDDKYFYNLPSDQKKKILDYPLFVYVCDGTDSEKLDWFRIINIAGEQLTDQELRNAVYAGSWTSDAKRYFSKTGCAAGTLRATISRALPSGRNIWKPRSYGPPPPMGKVSKPTWHSIRTTPAPCSSGITSAA